MENQKAVGFLRHIDLDPMENHKATQPTFNARPAKSHLNGGLMVACFVNYDIGLMT